jgi:hypothetical protein
MNDIKNMNNNNNEDDSVIIQSDVVHSNDVTISKDSLKYIDEFEYIFNRPIYVQEFFKYIVENDPESLDWDALLVEHNFNYNKMRQMFQNYTGKSISEYFYVKKYLYEIDDSKFFDKFIDEIINSKEYMHGMIKVINEKYKNMFDQTLDERDIEYVFDIIKNKKLDIMNEEIDSILVKLKEETDYIISQIFKVYDETLNRPPEISEIEQHTSMYRKAQNHDEMNTCLEKMLINTLEYHDIIKNHIKDLYKTKHGKDISYSILYNVLNRVLMNIGVITNNKLDTIIDKQI